MTAMQAAWHDKEKTLKQERDKAVEAARSLLLPSSFLLPPPSHIVQELCESRGGRPGLSILTSFLVSVDLKLY